MNSRVWMGIAKLFGAVALIAIVVILLRLSPAGQHLSSVDDARAFVASLAPLDKPAFVLVYAVGALFLPGTLLSFVGAVLYGVWWGTLLVWCGAVLGCLAPYALARGVGRPAVESILGGDSESFQKFDRWIAERGFSGLLLVRFLPLFPFWLVNYGCGLVGVRFRDYLVATAIGIVPGTFVYQYLFASVGEAALRDGLRWIVVTDPNVLIPIGVFVLFLFAGRQAVRRLGMTSPEKTASAATAATIKPNDTTSH
jgi:uncharacterized membrane protein YdjX (TVP38/TMEM64 family)